MNNGEIEALAYKRNWINEEGWMTPSGHRYLRVMRTLSKVTDLGIDTIDIVNFIRSRQKTSKGKVFRREWRTDYDHGT